MPRAYVERTYRQRADSGLAPFSVVVEQTDLLVSAETNLEAETRASVQRHRRALERCIGEHPEFATSLTPLSLSRSEPLLAEMLRASAVCNVGPMAAVAGAIAEFVGRDLLRFSPQVLVENGGDLFVATHEERVLSIFAGESPLSERLGLKIPAAAQPLGVCTSSGTVGPSLSFGRADAATVVARSAAFADAAATALANRIHEAADIEPALEMAQQLEGLAGVVLIKGDRLGAWGAVELLRL
ncbi:MAG: hypothetical protein COZ06_21200 [Armatimonadetes bacterium CG_4_10_14_3_um_filter_66_18]|nr:UPF0280 family protein [Armatimonadota bacterium]OIP03555.1 MAG: hypothetical protein AUJ96_14405 [Armatimonadetes bacterium CG2_30_66_41]PIY44177.1 MAG: hypothetical protein COZ06_21200 [Armatimonadetes bacterium CG_4_10_14_3_um_filter_66_18]PIZ35630.1 MAG: hypothetical protein COY42_26560 [Armatimonadetes bacterium CG_4_10_14_0_8_um_filter_66_14]NCO92290.1 UPF0280 family protein [Armatimonadota bacterium]